MCPGAEQVGPRVVLLVGHAHAVLFVDFKQRIIISTILTILFSLWLSSDLLFANQEVIQYVIMFLMAHLYETVSAEVRRSAVFLLQRRERSCCAFLMTAVVLSLEVSPPKLNALYPLYRKFAECRWWEITEGSPPKIYEISAKASDVP